jgi:feruloyl-CoA synthase
MSSAFFDDPRLLAPRQTVKTLRPDGGFELVSPEPLQPYARCVGEWLEHWARDTPDAPSFAEPSAAGGWAVLNWRELRRQVGAVAQRLLDLDLPPGRPVVILSDNALHHLVLTLAALHVGRAVCAVSSGYCRLAQGDFGKIHGILRTLEPALVYASDAAVYAPALVDCGVPDALRVFSPRRGHRARRAGLRALAGHRRDCGRARRVPGHHARRPRPSTCSRRAPPARPKIAINTHRMLCANQKQMLAAELAFPQGRAAGDRCPGCPGATPSVPTTTSAWCCATAARFYIDEGRPVPGLMDRTSVRNLREVQPNAVLQRAPRLRCADAARAGAADDVLAPGTSSGRLKGMLFYAAAARCPRPLGDRLESRGCARRCSAEKVWFTSVLGRHRDFAPCHHQCATGVSTSRACIGLPVARHLHQVPAQRRTSSRCA